jgi:hypothetical protein
MVEHTGSVGLHGLGRLRAREDDRLLPAHVGCVPCRDDRLSRERVGSVGACIVRSSAGAVGSIGLPVGWSS